MDKFILWKKMKSVLHDMCREYHGDDPGVEEYIEIHLLVLLGYAKKLMTALACEVSEKDDEKIREILNGAREFYNQYKDDEVIQGEEEDLDPSSDFVSRGDMEEQIEDFLENYN